MGIKNKLYKFLYQDRSGFQKKQKQEIAGLKASVSRLENRFLNYYRNRYDAIDNFADYLVGAEIPGDYWEFGVYTGTIFSYTYKVMESLFNNMHFIALDSFQGLPIIQGVDLQEGYSSSFFEGQFSCSKIEFIENLKKNEVDLSRVITIEGWFNRTLNSKTVETYGLGKIALAWIDSDLYESTATILKFITPLLSQGTIIAFDDWRCFRNLPDRGQQLAVREWLQDNSQITLNEFISFGFHGKSFTIGSC